MKKVQRITGWMLDVYPADLGMRAWVLDKESGKRHSLLHPLDFTLYIGGKAGRLRKAWSYIREKYPHLNIYKSRRTDAYIGPVDLISISSADFDELRYFFYSIQKVFPDLTFYDADIPPEFRFSAATGSFPLAEVELQVFEENILELNIKNTRWDIDFEPPPLRILRLSPNCNPQKNEPSKLIVEKDEQKSYLVIARKAGFIKSVCSLILNYDPDIIMTEYGDSWLFPMITTYAKNNNIANPLNRDHEKKVFFREASSFFSYGQTVFRDQEIRLFGRFHIDERNSFLFGEGGLGGILEMARVTGQNPQLAARRSPGAGLTGMQMIEALKSKQLVPYEKRQIEDPKTARELMKADRGGLIFQPIIGVHQNAIELDFHSMYPSIMVNKNISPETVRGTPLLENRNNTEDHPPTLGIVPRTLVPLLEKRLKIKRRMRTMDERDIRYEHLKSLNASLKWLLIISFGFTGYKLARFGIIKNHERITAYARELLLDAKVVAEEAGFTILHAYIDSLTIQKDDKTLPSMEEISSLIDQIDKETGLIIELEGIYRFVAYLPSRMNNKWSVANRYFGVFRNGKVKLRGIAARRRDTPAFIKQMQQDLVEMLGGVAFEDINTQAMPKIYTYLRYTLSRLRNNEISIEALISTTRLSRDLEKYKSPSPAARAGFQLRDLGIDVSAGQKMKFLFTLGKPGVWAWDKPGTLNPSLLDRPRYIKLFIRAATEVLEPFGVSEKMLRDWLFANASYGAKPGRIAGDDYEFPMFSF